MDPVIPLIPLTCWAVRKQNGELAPAISAAGRCSIACEECCRHPDSGRCPGRPTGEQPLTEAAAAQVIKIEPVGAAADIWSVGCLALELLTGAPPYFQLEPMSALFRIVQDDRPPLPDGLSREMRDFLLLCFQKVRPLNRAACASACFCSSPSCRSLTSLACLGSIPAQVSALILHSMLVAAACLEVAVAGASWRLVH